jgi:hypothetical protein
MSALEYHFSAIISAQFSSDRLEKLQKRLGLSEEVAMENLKKYWK